MIKQRIIFLLFIIPIILVGCNNNTEDISNENNKLRTENESLYSEIEQLKNEIIKNKNVITDYESTIMDLESNIDKLSKSLETVNTDISFSDKYKEYDEQRKKDVFNFLKNELISSNNNGEKNSEYKNLFEPDFVNKGDVFGDSVVASTYITDNIKSILFEGEYEVTATYVYADIGNILIIDNFKEQIPHTIYDINRSIFTCEVSNQEEFINELGDNFKEELDYGVKVKAVFRDLNYNIQYETDRYSTIKFVKLIEIVEEQ